MPLELVTPLPPGAPSHTRLARHGERLVVLREILDGTDCSWPPASPGLVTLQEVGELQGKRHALFAWVPGVTLRDLLEALALAGRPASIGLVGRIVVDAARALASANAPRAHGGLSDAALQVGFDGVVSVLDWGAPRVSRFKPLGRVNFAADVFSLGAVLHAALTGHAGDYTPLPSTLPQPSHTHPEATPAIDAVVFKAIAVQADDRQPGVGALADELEVVLGEQLATRQQLGDEVRALFRDRIKLLQSLGGIIEPARDDLEAVLPGALAPIPTGTQAYGSSPLLPKVESGPRPGIPLSTQVYGSNPALPKVESGPRPGIPLGTQPSGSNPMLPAVKALENEPLEIGEHERTQVRIPIPPEKPMVPWDSSPDLPAAGDVAEEGTQPGVFAPTSRDEAPRRASGSHAIPVSPRASAPRPSRPAIAIGPEVEESKTGPQPVLVEEASKTGPSEVHEPALGDDDGLAATGAHAVLVPPDGDSLSPTGERGEPSGETTSPRIAESSLSPAGVRGDTTSPGVEVPLPAAPTSAAKPVLTGSRSAFAPSLSPAGERGDATSPGVEVPLPDAPTSAAKPVLTGSRSAFAPSLSPAGERVGVRGDTTSPGVEVPLPDAPTSAGGPAAKPVLTGSRSAFKPADSPSSTGSDRPGSDKPRVTGTRSALPEGRRPTGLDALNVDAVRATEPPTSVIDVPDDTQPRAKLRPSGVPSAQLEGATNPRIPLPPERTDPIGTAHEDTNPQARAPLGDPETVEPTRPRAPRPSRPSHVADSVEDSDTAPRPRNTTDEERARARGQERVATPPRGIEVMGEEFADLNEPTAVRKRIVEPIEEPAELNEPTAVRKRVVEPVEDDEVRNEPTAVRNRPTELDTTASQQLPASSGAAVRVVMVVLLLVVVAIAGAVVLKLKAQAEAEPVPEPVEELDAGLIEEADAGAATPLPVLDDLDDAGEDEEDDDAGVEEDDAGTDEVDAGVIDAGTPDAGKAVKKAPVKKTVKKKKRRR